MVELKLILLIFCSLLSIFRLLNSRAILSLSCSCVSYFLLKSDSADTKKKKNQCSTIIIISQGRLTQVRGIACTIFTLSW